MDKLNKFVAITISIIILGFSLFFLISDKKNFSENEFRYLQKFPEFSWDNLFDGKYIKGLEDYSTDHFPLREFFVSLKTSVYTLSLQTLVNDVYIAKDNFLINRFDKPKNSDKIIKILNNFKRNNENINIEILISPTSSSIYQDLLPKNNINYSEREAILYYYDNLELDSIDIYDTLMKEKDNYQLFYKTDHHWTSFGAYFAYLEYAKHNDIDYYKLDELKKEEVSDKFLGTLYSKVFTFGQEKDKIYKINLSNYNFTVQYMDKVKYDFYEESYLLEKDKYSYFLGTNQPLIEITNNNFTGSDELLIVKDSYANSFIPLIANHYKKVYVIDLRYYNIKLSDYIKENNIKNVLFLYNINNIDNDTGILSVR